MRDVDRKNTVDRQETLVTEPVPAGAPDAGPLPAAPAPAGPLSAEPLPAAPFANEPVRAEPLPADETGLETGRNDPSHDDSAHDDRVDGDRAHDDRTHDGSARDDRVRDRADDGDGPGGTARDARPGHETPLFTGDTVTQLRARWRELQAGFVDDPQRAVREADEVLDEVVRTITEHRQRLGSEREGRTDTEDLRLAMQQYRSVFDQLLPMT